MSDKLREAFEREFSKPPFEWNFERFPNDTYSWPGRYRQYHIECAWEGFQAGHAHAMRGEKVYRLEVKVDGDWRPYDDNFLSDKEEAQGYIHLFGMDQKKARIVTYIRQEKE